MFRKTVNGIVSDITRKVEQLRAVQEAEQARANKLTDKANVLLDKSEAAGVESQRAARLAERFEALISV